MTRYFIGWDTPFLPACADKLFALSKEELFCDLSSLIVVLPSARAARRLLELLAIKAREKEKILHPPQFVSVGDLPKTILPAPPTPFPSEAERLFIWEEALRRLPSEQRNKLFEDKFLARKGLLQWARKLSEVYSLVTGSGWSFSEVAEKAPTALIDFPDEERWEILALLEEEILLLHEEYGFTEEFHWYLQGAKGEISCEEGGKVLLIGASDLPPLFCQLLEQYGNTECWIAAPEQHAPSFDEWGRVRVQEWLDVPVEVEPSQITLVSTLFEGPETLLHLLGRVSPDTSVNELTIGVLDERTAGPTASLLKEVGVPCHRAEGIPLFESSGGTFLLALCRVLETPIFKTYAAVLRHPLYLFSVPEELRSKLLEEVEQFGSHHIPHELREQIPPRFRTLTRELGRVKNLIAPFLSEHNTFSAWQETLCALLRYLAEHGFLTYDQREEVFALIEQVERICRASLSLSYTSLSGLEFLDSLLLLLDGARYERSHLSGAVDLVGWLELAFDDAPWLFLLGVNEGVVPAPLSEEPLLPESLRKLLDLPCQDTREARDAFLLSVILKSHKQVVLCVAQKGLTEERLLPSRLLLRVPRNELPERVSFFFGSQGTTLPGVVGRSTSFRGTPELYYPIPERISLTGIIDYRACPFRFALRHILKLRSYQEVPFEIPPSLAGSLLHELFALYATHSHEFREGMRKDYLLSEFRERFTRQFGHFPAVPLKLQHEILEEKILRFYEWHELRQKEGWEIKAIEEPLHYTLPTLNGKLLTLEGRIDRLEHHKDSGEWQVFDFKLGDVLRTPQKRPNDPDNWHDLQLALYLLLSVRVGKVPEEVPVKVGYLSIPSEPTEELSQCAAWGTEVLPEVEKIVHECASAISAGKFWPPGPGDERYPEYTRLMRSVDL